ncbi:MAG: DNA topology modulation protein [Pleurocapsa sp.]
MQRIAIIGCCGSGKSTLAVKLGLKLNLPVIHLDSYYWKAGWIESSEEEWIDKQKLLVKRDRWIIDGNYLNTMDIRLEAADTVILLDFSRWLCLWRIGQRYLHHRGKVRSDMADGCIERFNMDFLWYVWNFANNQKESILSKLELYKYGKQIIILKNTQQLKDFLSELN